jgi:hypothetical protein
MPEFSYREAAEPAHEPMRLASSTGRFKALGSRHALKKGAEHKGAAAADFLGPSFVVGALVLASVYLALHEVVNASGWARLGLSEAGDPGRVGTKALESMERGRLAAGDRPVDVCGQTKRGLRGNRRQCPLSWVKAGRWLGPVAAEIGAVKVDGRDPARAKEARLVVWKQDRPRVRQTLRDGQRPGGRGELFGGLGQLGKGCCGLVAVQPDDVGHRPKRVAEYGHDLDAVLLGERSDDLVAASSIRRGILCPGTKNGEDRLQPAGSSPAGEGGRSAAHRLVDEMADALPARKDPLEHLVRRPSEDVQPLIWIDCAQRT